jgi:CubicO group peptidase (beta-lactamase class C family)
MPKTQKCTVFGLMKRTAVPALVFSLLCLSISGEENAASQNWVKFKTPEDAGFSSSKLQDAKTYWESLRPALAATMVIYKGKVLVAWGDTTSPYMCHSVRKSFLSGLYGPHVKNGNIDLQKTMADLGIDDVPPLTEAEKQAKVIQLLKARSGVYHEAAYESAGMKELRPERGSHAPGTFWYYNNWDFNVLGVIFEQETGTKIFEEFKTRIADPIGMQDFRVDLCYYHYEWDLSIHPAYPFQMTARDRARFGQLFLQEGRWNDTQIIPKKWVKKSTKSYSDVSTTDAELKGFGYGYMWWTLADNVPVFQDTEHLKDMGACYYASGYGGHRIMVLPKQEMVFVPVVDTFQGFEVSMGESLLLLENIFAAREQDIFDLKALKVWPSRTAVKQGENITVSARVRNLSRKTSIPTGVDFYLSKNQNLNAKDIHIGYAELPGSKYKKKKVVKLDTTILATVAPGEYYLIARIDKDNLNLDPYPKNNMAVSAGKIKIASPPIFDGCTMLLIMF